MAQFTVNATRFDPYQNFKFRVRYNNADILGVSKVTGLTRTTTPVKHRDGAAPNIARSSPGATEYTPITLERGVTHDTTFEEWANLAFVYNLGGSAHQMSYADFRRDLVITLYDEIGNPAIAYKVYRCWVSEYTALPDLDANSAAVAIQSIKLEHEGWERDTALPEPKES